MNVASLDTVNYVEIPAREVNIITQRLIAVMQDRIDNISPDDDPYAEYGRYWTEGSYENDDSLELTGLCDAYDISYRYSLSWQCQVWTEHWSDPACSPSFSEVRNQAGEVYNIEIYTPVGDMVKQSICDRISETVNHIIKHL